MNKTPRLNIPLLAGLDNLDPDQIPAALEEGGARISIETLAQPQQFPYRPLTVVTAAHSETALYLDFLVRCNYLRAENYTDNSPVSEDSSVGFRVDAAGLGRGHLDIEMNCIGSINARRVGLNDNGTPLRPDELGAIRRYASVGQRPFCEVEGSFIWNVAMAIPFSLLGVNYVAGEPVMMMGNFDKTASATSQPHYLSWAPQETLAPITLL